MVYKKKIRPKWENIYTIQNKLERKLRKNNKAFIDSVKMVSGELLENAIKYYNDHNNNKYLEYFYSDNDGVEISIRNQQIEYDDMVSVTAFIDKIKESKSPYNLYVERLQEILENRIKGESKLGLLRVASDSSYTLDYEVNNNFFNITAKMKSSGGKKQMKRLEYEDLIIEVTELDSYVEVSWIGKCRTLNPEHILDNYLSQVCNFLRNKKAVISFEKLESMNSSTIPPLLTFIRILEENSIDAIFVYDDKEDWQNASFKPLSIITGSYKNVEIKPISAFKNM